MKDIKKTISISPLKDIIYNGEHKKGSKPFIVPIEIGKSLIKIKAAKEEK